ncbi:hypothetical protein MRX96_003971 [Rhipicephalus microplus]
MKDSEAFHLRCVFRDYSQPFAPALHAIREAGGACVYTHSGPPPTAAKGSAGPRPRLISSSRAPPERPVPLRRAAKSGKGGSAQGLIKPPTAPALSPGATACCQRRRIGRVWHRATRLGSPRQARRDSGPQWRNVRVLVTLSSSAPLQMTKRRFAS